MRNGVVRKRTLKDPLWNADISVAEFGASLQAIYEYGRSADRHPNLADIAGWGGDLIIFYADWRRLGPSRPTGSNYCFDHLFAEPSYFRLRDLIVDLDAYRLGMALKTQPQLDIATAIRNNLVPGGGYRIRIQRFLNVDGRLGSHTIRELTDLVLTDWTDLDLGVAREDLIRRMAGDTELPECIPKDELDDFLDGFSLMSSAQIEAEKDKWSS
jgi:hypothetical protein